MRYALIGILFCLCVLVGYVFSSKYTKRKRFFDSLISLAEKLSLEINFSRERLHVLIENFDEKNKRNLLGIDTNFVEYLDKKVDLSTDELFKKIDILKQEEKDAVFLFFKTLGRSDVENQTKEIQSFVNRFRDIKSQCEVDHKKYGSLSLKLGIVAGLFLVVILI